MQRPAAIWKRLQLRHDMLRKQARENNPTADASGRDHGKQHGGRLARGKLSPVQLASVGVEGLGQAAALLVLAVLALLALYLKLEQLKEVTQLGPHQWSARNWLQVLRARRTACLSISQWVAQPDFGRQIGIVAACWLPVLDLRRRLAASQKSDLTRDAGLNQSLE
jgi:hypothetical protein